LFVQFLNDQILNLYGLPERLGKKRLSAHVRRLLWSASLLSEEPLIVPTVDIIQSPVSEGVLDLVKGLADEGLLELVGSTTDLDDFLRRKRIHFHGTGLHPEWGGAKAARVLETVKASLNARSVNTTSDMIDQWSGSITGIANSDSPSDTTNLPLAQRQLLHAYKLLPSESSFLSFLDKAHDLPARLGDHAFLWNVVERVDAFQMRTRPEATAPFERALAYYWAYSHLREYRTNLIGHDYVVGWIDCGIRYDHPSLAFDLAGFARMLQMVRLTDLLAPTNVGDLCALKYDPVATAAISGVLLPWFSELNGYPGRRDEVLSRLRRVARSLPGGAGPQFDVGQRWRAFDRLLAVADMGRSPDTVGGITALAQGGSSSRDPSRTTIFIGHGRSLIWMQLRDLLTQRLGLAFEEFNRVPVAGLTATERLRQMLDASEFAFIILTGEDETADGALRARQNVVHELGLFQGRLGFDRAIVLIEEGCEEFTNIAGLQELRFPSGNVMAISEEIRRVLEERL
jgi:hypothetical protein